MPEPKEDAPAHVNEKRATEYLANERTFLAWVRTSVAVISLGFVVARFSLWLREAGMRFGSQMPSRPTGASLPIGELMIAFGALLPVVAAWRYHVVNGAIERGEVKPDRGLVVLITAVISLVAIAMVVYLLTTSGH